MITPLITRLEEAGDGSQELSALVMMAFRAPDGRVEQSPINGNWCVYDAAGRLLENRSGPYGWWRREGWPVTESIDAALALAERVLPEWEWLLRTDKEGGFMVNCWRKGDEPNMGDECFPSYAATPALALCIAILKANHKDKP